MLEVLDRLVQHRRDVVVTERVDDRPTLTPGTHEVEMAQQPELVRDSRLLSSQAGRSPGLIRQIIGLFDS
jgi:hypothetical protein